MKQPKSKTHVNSRQLIKGVYKAHQLGHLTYPSKHSVKTTKGDVLSITIHNDPTNTPITKFYFDVDGCLLANYVDKYPDWFNVHISEGRYIRQFTITNQYVEDCLND